MSKQKTEIITFKADNSLLKALQGVSNRSEFIRAAVLNALESACPLCLGTGIMSPEQKKHWDDFRRDHAVEECGDCHERHIVCVKK